ncbi:hypothetical protein GGR88_000677 [Sphingomonas jejuensis]|uniref:Uncharacterized protein n=1 Tax=Sphingomonas jejuensis TaxID=904715 RepID=A0ABX0XJ64_9SPHN|nr:hypothetical protein [Sphingomonas jejuensis]NJC33203.1 hypothetical protein [Sphingomonas jejuensis]
MIAVALGALLFAVEPAVLFAQAVGVRVRTQRSLIRVPVPRGPPPRPERWREQRGPRCVAVDSLAGAHVNRDNSVDLILRGGGRVRARLDGSCPAMDLYSGFYVRPGRDGMVCADRDGFRSRSGGACEIDGFRRLVPDDRRRRDRR